jgi:hypothetical protein
MRYMVGTDAISTRKMSSTDALSFSFLLPSAPLAHSYCCCCCCCCNCCLTSFWLLLAWDSCGYCRHAIMFGLCLPVAPAPKLCDQPLAYHELHAVCIQPGGQLGLTLSNLLVPESATGVSTTLVTSLSHHDITWCSMTRSPTGLCCTTTMLPKYD